MWAVEIPGSDRKEIISVCKAIEVHIIVRVLEVLSPLFSMLMIAVMGKVFFFFSHLFLVTLM